MLIKSNNMLTNEDLIQLRKDFENAVNRYFIVRKNLPDHGYLKRKGVKLTKITWGQDTKKS